MQNWKEMMAINEGVDQLLAGSSCRKMSEVVGILRKYNGVNIK